MNNLLSINRPWLIAGLVLSQLLLLANAMLGQVKSWALLDFFDIAGECGTATLIFIWWWILLSIRPGGRVSQLLFSGVLLLFLAALQDGLDEFFSLDQGSLAWLLGHVESFCLPLGMLLLTFGLIFWRDEQKIINAQLSGRERYFRDHSAVDQLTQLSNHQYLNKQLQWAAKQAQNQQQSFCLALIDFDGFSQLNREYGFKEGDRYLKAVAELLVLNLRPQDIICRFAGDRFALVLNPCDEPSARQILVDCLQLIGHFGFRSELGARIQCAATGGLAQYHNGNLDELFTRAKTDLLKAKSLKLSSQNAA